MSLIEARSLTLSYENMTVIKDLSFEVNGGDFLCIVGENGSGKSTLVKALLSLKKPVGGEIVFGDGLKRREIGYLPQQTGVQRDFPAGVFEVVLSGCLNQRGLLPFYSAAQKQLAMENLRLLGADGLAKRSYCELSGGQQQRVLLARALCATQKLLLLDEPVSGLDPIVTASMYELICELNSKHKVTIIMVSHDIQAALKYATHILCLRADDVFFGTTAEFLRSPVSDFLGGGAQDD